MAFAQHSGGETADWDAPKLERGEPARSSTPRAGRMPRTYGPGLWLGWGENGSGLGCDVANGEPVRIDPDVRLIPSDDQRQGRSLRLGDVRGHWGERETWVYDGPTGPALKTAVDGAGELDGGSARRLDPGQRRRNPRPAPAISSAPPSRTAPRLFTLFTPYPLLIISLIAIGLGIAIWALPQSWQALRETWARLLSRTFRVFAAIGGILLPATLAVSALQYLLATNADFAALTGCQRGQPGTADRLGVGLALAAGVAPLNCHPRGRAGGGRHRGRTAAERTPRLRQGSRSIPILSGPGPRSA